MEGYHLFDGKSLFTKDYLLSVGLFFSLVFMHWGFSVNPHTLDAYLPFGVFVLFELAEIAMLTLMTISLPFAAVYSVVIEPRRRHNSPSCPKS